MGRPRQFDLTGRRFGRIVVIKDVGHTATAHVLWLCLCDCGSNLTRTTSNILQVGDRAVGCAKCIAAARARWKTKHGGAGRRVGEKTRVGAERLYHVWLGMKQRCYTPTSSGYKWYGAKGISICAEWQHYPTFRTWALSHCYDRGLTIERINAGGNYEPANCEWITQSENSRRRNLRVVK